MKQYLRIDTSLGCKLRTTSVQLIAQSGGSPERQQIPATPMPGRRLIRIINFGQFGAFPTSPTPTGFHIMVGDQDVYWASVNDFSGISMRIYDTLELEVDETIPLFGVLSPALDPETESVDVRVLEIG